MAVFISESNIIIDTKLEKIVGGLGVVGMPCIIFRLTWPAPGMTISDIMLSAGMRGNLHSQTTYASLCYPFRPVQYIHFAPE